MADTPIDSANQLLNAFVHRKKAHDNTTAIEAQRLVNLFRQLSVFKPEFVAEYNRMLLNASDEVRMMMKDIVGGPTVRQYLDFLQAKTEHISEDEESEYSEMKSELNNNTGYLPDPDEDIPFAFRSMQAGSAQSTPEIVADFSQSDALMQILNGYQEANRKQTEALTDALKELKNQLKKNGNTSLSSAGDVKESVAVQDLIQFQETQQAAFEQFIRAQTEIISTLTDKLTQMSIAENVVRAKTATSDLSTPEEAGETEEPIALSTPEEADEAEEPVALATPEEADEAEEPVALATPKEADETEEPVALATPEEAGETEEPVALATPEEADEAEEPVVLSTPEEVDEAEEPVALSTPEEADEIIEQTQERLPRNESNGETNLLNDSALPPIPKLPFSLYPIQEEPSQEKAQEYDVTEHFSQPDNRGSQQNEKELNDSQTSFAQNEPLTHSHFVIPPIPKIPTAGKLDTSLLYKGNMRSAPKAIGLPKAPGPAWRKTMQSASGTMGSAEKKNIHTAETKQSEKPTEDIEILNDIEI